MRSRHHGLLRCAGGAALLLLPAIAAAGVGWEISALSWRYDVEGLVAQDGEELDFEDDLAVKARAESRFGVELRGLPGWWPDVGLTHSRIGGSGRNTVEDQTLFGVIVIAPGSEVTTVADFDDDELVARWGLRRGRWTLSPGVVVKHLDGTVVITDTSDGSSTRQPYDQWFPELHAGFEWRWRRNVQLRGAVQGSAYRENSALEWRALVDFGWLRPLHFMAGWQEKRYEIEVSDYRLDTRLSGPLLGLTFRFR